jgi:hypothetical protein
MTQTETLHTPLFLQVLKIGVFEYRRFAITEKVLVTDQSARHAVYRLRFCSLYPFDERENEPERFLPGQAVEIQARIGKVFISRFYSPIGIFIL